MESDEKSRLSLEEKMDYIEKSANLNDLPLKAMPDVFDDDFYFVSYSHRDYKAVYKDLLELENSGIQIWYDRGMVPGKNWAEKAEEILSKYHCRGVIFYLSENALRSDAIFDEVLVTRKWNKPFFSINFEIDGVARNVEDMLRIYGIQGKHNKELISFFNKDIIFLGLNAEPERKVEQIGRFQAAPEFEYSVEEGLAESGEKDTIELLSLNNKEITRFDRTKLPDEKDIVVLNNALFANIKTLKEVDFTDIQLMAWNESIPNYCFYGCAGLVSITLPSYVTTIGDYAFFGCISLTSIKIPDYVKGIGEFAFSGCKSITSIEISSSVRVIKCNAFEGCTGLTSIKLSSSIKRIAERVFKGCTSLPYIKIPSSVKRIAERAFEGCTGLKSIEIPSSVKIIESGAFQDCLGLTSIRIPPSVEVIAKRTFKGCCRLVSIELPISVEIVEEEAFADCTDLTSISIPSSVNKIERRAFYDCTSLTSIMVDSANPNYKSEGNCLLSKDGKKLFQGCKTSVIPKSVISIESDAFSWCKALTSIELPSSVISIGECAFHGCTFLTSIAFPESVTSIGYGSFAVCSSLKSVTIPASVTSIDAWAFDDCTSLTSIIIPDSVTSIGDSVFRNCISLVRIRIGHSVTSIGMDAFRNCRSLTTLLIPNSVSEIFGAFSGCSNLKTIFCEAREEPFGWYWGWEEECKPKVFWYSKTPNADGNHWHYDVDGKTPVIWK